MKQGKKLILMLVYYLLFMYSFFGFYKTRRFLDGKGDMLKIGFDLFGKTFEIVQSTNIPGIKIVYAIFIILSFLAALMLIITVISYNIDVIKDEHKELEENRQ